MKRIFVLALALFAFGPSAARAQQIHAGVDVGAVVPAAMRVVDVVVPDRAESPVRLSLAAQDDGQAALLVDVWVTPESRAARERYQHALAELTSVVAEAPGLGDSGVADAGFAAFVRDNVAVAIRRIRGGHDVVALARQIDRAIAASPAGPARASRALQLPDLDAMAVGEHATITLPTWALDASFTAHGDARVRRTRDGWLLTRTGDGPARLEAHAVDHALRPMR